MEAYISKPYQTRNLMELLEVICHHKKREDEVSVMFLTKIERDYFENKYVRLLTIKYSTLVSALISMIHMISLTQSMTETSH